MDLSRLKRRFEETLSEGRGMQLLWLLVIIAVVILVFWAVVSLIFRDGTLVWQDLMALFLDPGSFGGAGSHDIFRLVAALCGMFLFSALLISVVSNMFENIADSFKNGYSRYKHSDHVLILGGGSHLFSMLSALVAEDSPYKDNQIVVMTTQPVDALRTKVFSFFDGEQGKSLRRRVTFYHGERDNENNLKEKNLAANARVIYLIGEDSEQDHDSVNVRCCKKLQAICKGDRAIPCYMVFHDSASLDVYKYISDAETSKGTCLKVDVIDANEYIAEQVLVADHDGKDVISYPEIDYRCIEKDVDGNFKVIPGIGPDSDRHVHFVVSGTSDMARAMALTAAHICHFPNFKDGSNRTVITIVDKDVRAWMDGFISSLPGLFKLSHYRYVSIDGCGNISMTEHRPDVEYGDFLDIEWEFIDSELSSPGMRSRLKTWSEDESQSLSLAICLPTQQENTFSALHLPDEIYAKGCPVFVHQQDYGDILSQAKITRHFGNIHIVGMASSLQDDPLYVCRSRNGQRVNFIYNQAYGDRNGIKYSNEIDAWYVLPEAHKFSSIYCANAMYIRSRSFGLPDFDTSALTDGQRAAIYEVEHRRWTMSALILGYSPVVEEARKEWKGRRENPETAQAAKDEYKVLKNKKFIHMDITPYEDLIASEKDKDELIISRLSYILGSAPYRK